MATDVPAHLSEPCETCISVVSLTLPAFRCARQCVWVLVSDGCIPLCLCIDWGFRCCLQLLGR